MPGRRRPAEGDGLRAGGDPLVPRCGAVRTAIGRGILACAALLLTACADPFFLLPGGSLEGRAAPVPESWAALRDIKTIQLETRPADPYSVNIWIIGLGADRYVHAGANRAEWVEHLEADPDVRLRVGEELYELQAVPVTDGAEFARFADAYEDKYGRRPRNENVSEAYLFRLGPRA